MKIIFILLLLLNTRCSYSQTNLDSLFSTLKNKDLEVSFIIPLGACLTCGKRTLQLNQDSLKRYKRYSIITSFEPNDIFKLARQYSEHLIIKKLYALLTDTSRDFYANALLYDLLNNIRLIDFYFSPRRETWISSGRKEKDYALWDSTMKSITLYN